MRPFTARRRPGFTLVELIISMSLLLFVFGVAASFFNGQSRLVTEQSGRLDAQQTAQFALSQLDRDLRLAGVGVADMQPTVVQAHPRAVTFNANLVSEVPGDPASAYVDVEADPKLTNVLTKARAVLLPLSTTTYPETTHVEAAGTPSRAETISFWVALDSTTPDENDYALFRRVNDGATAIAAGGILLGSDDVVFEYYRPDTAGKPRLIETTSLPIYHTEPTHGSPGDTGQVALTDSIISVRARLTVAYRDRNGQVTRRLEHTVRLMNAGLIHRRTCGEPPTGVTPAATAALDTLGLPQVTITWGASSDETAGERDVERYALFRRQVGTDGISEPFVSVPAGLASYSWTDSDVRSGEQWVYSVASMDCTPSSSGATAAPTVTIP